MFTGPTSRRWPAAALFACALGAATARAETPDPKPEQMLSVDPIWFIYQTASFRYERLLSQSGSVALDLRFGRAHVTPSEGLPYDRTLVGLGLGYHYYPMPDAPRGFFIAPGIDFLRRFETVSGNTSAVFVAVPFLELGYNWMHSSGFYAGGSIGEQYVLGNIKDDVGGLGSLSGLVPRVSAHLGYAW